jgi:hypothetical protein
MGQLAYDVGSAASPLRGIETQPTSAACLNCQTPLTGPFCANCGQRDVPPYPSVRELAVDAFWELSGWDGRFASTVKALFRRPGMLTVEFLEGRRARYLSPLRLYLMASLAYFLVAATAPAVKTASGKTVFAGVHIGETAPKGPISRPERLGMAASDALKNQQTLSVAEKEAAIKDIAKAPALLRPLLRRSIEDPTGYKRGLIEMMPRMLFALLPIFAAIVAMLYRGRKYPEHLYFAIHLHAFLFLALLLSGLAKFTQLPVVVGLVGFAVLLWIPVYSTLAFRRVYGGSIVGTLAKEATIAVLYGIVSLIGLLVVVYWVSLTG